jgi:hypothetical protein
LFGLEAITKGQRGIDFREVEMVFMLECPRDLADDQDAEHEHRASYAANLLTLPTINDRP